MKRKKRVRRGGRVASLRASGDVEQERPMSGREQWRERDLELRRWLELPKKRVTLNLDADVLTWFRGMGRGYQWEINKALRRVMESERRAGTLGPSRAPSPISRPALIVTHRNKRHRIAVLQINDREREMVEQIAPRSVQILRPTLRRLRNRFECLDNF